MPDSYFKNSPFVLLENSTPDKDNNQSYLFKDFVDILTFRHKDNLADFFAKIQDALDKGFWLCGYFSYEFGYYLEPALSTLRKDNGSVLAWLGVCKKPLVTGNPVSVPTWRKQTYKLSSLKPNIRFKEYCSGIRKIKHFLKEGFTYEVNYTFKNKFSFMGNVLDFYLDLRNSQPTPYSALINTGKEYILSFSPELFLRIDNGIITVKPMKGTCARGLNADEDKEKQAWLENNEKIKAENLMIVDLLRNDLSRVCDSVKTVRLFESEKHRTLFQLTSTVRGKLREVADMQGVFSSLFPSGSVTGAPKIKTMMLIGGLENEPRGVYTGAIGYMNKDKACFNVAIRTLAIRDKRGEVGIGGGIVADSIGRQEFQEALLKSKFITTKFNDFMLIESILWEEGKGYFILQSHLGRLKKSCVYFSIPFNENMAKKRLNDYAKALPGGRFKVRVTVDINGKIKLARKKLKVVDEPVKIRISPRETDSTDLFLFHKTNQRQLYDKERMKGEQKGFFETIFLNEKSQLTEGTFTNIFALINGCLFTPPVSCGLLDGVFRKHLLDTGRAKEKTLHPADLKKADKIYIGNSVRGLLEAKL